MFSLPFVVSDWSLPNRPTPSAAAAVRAAVPRPPRPVEAGRLLRHLPLQAVRDRDMSLRRAHRRRPETLRRRVSPSRERHRRHQRLVPAEIDQHQLRRRSGLQYRDLLSPLRLPEEERSVRLLRLPEEERNARLLRLPEEERNARLLRLPEGAALQIRRFSLHANREEERTAAQHRNVPILTSIGELPPKRTDRLECRRVKETTVVIPGHQGYRRAVPILSQERELMSRFTGAIRATVPVAGCRQTAAPSFRRTLDRISLCQGNLRHPGR